MSASDAGFIVFTGRANQGKSLLQAMLQSNLRILSFSPECMTYQLKGYTDLWERFLATLDLPKPRVPCDPRGSCCREWDDSWLRRRDEALERNARAYTRDSADVDRLMLQLIAGDNILTRALPRELVDIIAGHILGVVRAQLLAGLVVPAGLDKSPSITWSGRRRRALPNISL